MNLPKKVTICEVGLRDGLQNEKTHLSTDQKKALIETIQNAGIKIIEVGSFVNPKAVPQMADTEEVFKKILKKNGVEYRVLILNEKGIERAAECGIEKAKFTISASRTHQIKNANKTHEFVFDQLEKVASIAADNGIILSGAVATAFGCPFEGQISVEKIDVIVDQFRKVGISEISLSDTTGMANPKQVFETCSRMLGKYPGKKWNLHFHNTRGMGFSNVLAGMQAGVERFDSSLGGLGGCPFAPGATGNIATEDLLNMCNEMGIETGTDIDLVIQGAKLLGNWIRHDLPSFLLKAGKNSDIHHDC
ncbi:hydroxymethylglutaryl-CoA lyase [Aminivibrio sp.]|uniref:hydroxymethylglutaryl-CoA lyase n=1 Tax=Aminivibrio sp. TaxID=1872489 RepID=UPI00345E55E2